MAGRREEASNPSGKVTVTLNSGRLCCYCRKNARMLSKLKLKDAASPRVITPFRALVTAEFRLSEYSQGQRTERVNGNLIIKPIGAAKRSFPQIVLSTTEWLISILQTKRRNANIIFQTLVYLRYSASILTESQVLASRDVWIHISQKQ